MGNPYNAAVTAETAAGIAINSVIFEVIKNIRQGLAKADIVNPCFFMMNLFCSFLPDNIESLLKNGYLLYFLAEHLIESPECVSNK